MRIRVIGGPITVEAGDRSTVVPTGNPQRLLGVVVANGGAATFERAGDSIDDDPDYWSTIDDEPE